MKKLSALAIVCSALAFSATAQKKLYLENHPVFNHWVDSPVVSPLPPEYASQPAIVLLNDQVHEFRFEGGEPLKNIGAHVAHHILHHRRIKVLNDIGINRFRVVDVPLVRGSKVPEVKARVILPSGEIKNVQKQHIQAQVHGGVYHVVMFLEGVVKNAEVEYLVREIRQDDLFGRIAIQNDLPVLRTHIAVEYPRNMVLDLRSHNGAPVFEREDDNARNHFLLKANDIKPLYPEKDAFYNLNRMEVEYRVSYILNDNKEKIKLNTWNKFARKSWDHCYKISEKEKKSVNRFLSDIGVRAEMDEAEKIVKIEEGIKKGIVLLDDVDYEQRNEISAAFARRSLSVYAVGYEDPRQVLDTIITKKNATPLGMLRLFAACYTQAGVQHEIGWAWDRTEERYDPSFESWMGLDHMLIYFPAQGKFLSPAAQFLRYPVVEPVVAGSRGVFCIIPPKGELTGQMYKVRRITPLRERDSRSDMTASVSFAKNMDATVNVSYEWGGYAAVGMRASLPFMRPDETKKFVTSIIPFAENEWEVTSYNFGNLAPENFSTAKPLTLYAQVHSPTLTGRAGSRYLLDLGNILGHHDDAYDKKPRVMPVDFLYPHSSRRTITVNIPRGYRVLNLSDLRASADYVNADLEEMIAFNADYSFKRDAKNGDKLVITIEETYRQVHFPLWEYGTFKKVMNTAADYNNVTLVLSR